jgi:hypothetical protein
LSADIPVGRLVGVNLRRERALRRAPINPRGVWVGVPGLLYVGLLILTPRLDVSRDTRAVIIGLGAVIDVAVIALVARWAGKAHKVDAESGPS